MKEKYEYWLKFISGLMIKFTSGLNERKVRILVEMTKVREVHLTGFEEFESKMKYRNQRVFMGGTLRPPEFSRSVTDVRIIKNICKQLK